MTNYTIFTTTPQLTSNSDQPVNLGTEFWSTADAWIVGMRWLVPANSYNLDTRTMTVYSEVDHNTPVIPYYNSTPTTADGGTWKTVDITPYKIAANVRHKVVLWIPTNAGYVAEQHYFDGTGYVDHGVLRIPLTASSLTGQGTYVYGSGLGWPEGSFNASSYYVDVIVSDTDPAATTPTVHLKHYESSVWVLHTAKPKVYLSGGWVSKVPKRWDASTGTWVNLP